jgi:glucokinase
VKHNGGHRELISGDIGGGTVRLGLVSDGEVVHAFVEPTPSDADELFWRLGQHIKSYLEDVPEDTVVAVGFPGPVRRTRYGDVVDGCNNIKGLRNVAFSPYERLIAQHPDLGGLSFITLNDAEAAVHAVPPFIGRPNNLGVVTYLGLGTHIAGESAINHTLCSDMGGPGVHGRIPVVHEGLTLPLWRIASGEAIKNIYGKGLRTARELAHSTSTDASAAWYAVGSALGQAVNTLSDIIGTECVVIGGGVARAAERFGKTTIEALRGPKPELIFLPDDMIETFGLRGAYWAALHRSDPSH